MSAWIVSDKHIDHLVQGLVESEIVIGIEPDEIGRTLWRENVKSIHARYSDTRENDANYPGAFDGWKQGNVEAYTYRVPDPRPSHSQLLKDAHCYNYQSCEHDEWPASQSHAWIRTLMDNLERAGVDYSVGDGAWGQPWHQELAA